MSARHLLTVDLGNTRCKLQRWALAGAAGSDPAASPEAGLELATAATALAELERWLAAGPPLAACAACGVGPRALEADLLERLAAWAPVFAAPGPEPPLADPLAGGAAAGARGVGAPARRPLDPGLDVACREPAAVGRDRLFAARGAVELLGRTALVVDVGTALTVDLVRVPSAGGWPVFEGGAIAPGPRLLARALAAHAARLPDVTEELEPEPPALGRDTRAAIRAGVAVGLAGAARELCAAIAREAGLDGAPVVLTGGAAAFVAGALAERLERVDPDLVHRGLRAAWRDAARGERPGGAGEGARRGEGGP